MNQSRWRAPLALAVVSLCGLASAQFPNRIYYKFDEGTGVGGTTANVASTPVGSLFATVTGHSLVAGGGQYGGHLAGATVSPGTSWVDTGWTTAFGTSSWTISFWADVSTIPTTTLYYAFGDSTAGSFRCFFNGAAGVGSCMLRGGFTDVFCPGAGLGGPHVVTWVYDATGPVIRAYLDGVQVSSVAQGALNINGTGTLRAAFYSSASTWGGGAKLDEFRVYGYALTAAEVAATWNQTLFDVNVLSISQSAPGVGDLNLSLGNLSPTATEGWTLLSANTAIPAGTGPFLGIWPDATSFSIFLSSPLFDGNPFHFLVPSPLGLYPSNPLLLGPGAVSSLAGQTFDIVTLMVRPGPAYDSKSNVVRFQFQ